MAIAKSRLHGTVGLLLILLIGFGFGAFLLMQPKSIESHQSEPGSSSAVQSHGEPSSAVQSHEDSGMEMDAHGAEEAAGHGTEEAPQNNSPIMLLSIFFGINVALILAALILKRVRSKKKVLPREPAPILEFEGGSK